MNKEPIKNTKTDVTPRKRSRPFVARTESYTKTDKKKSPRNKTSSFSRPHPKPNFIKKPNVKLPPIGKSIRIIPLGGVEEVGRNMTVVEYGNDILVFDAGVQFTNEVTPGIDFMLPNTTYLEDNKDRIRGLIITHGHLDHIGGIPYILDRIGNPPIYTRNLTAIMIKKRLDEIPTESEPVFNIVDHGDNLKLGDLHLKFFNVTHSILDSMGISVGTPDGNVVITGDLRLKHKDGVPTEEEENNWKVIEGDKNLLLIADSTNVENQGWSIPEETIQNNLENIIKNIPGRIIIGSFASQFARLIEIVRIAEKYNKKIVLEGRSIKNNLEMAQLAGFFKPEKGSIIDSNEINNYPPDKILILATGAQGEEFAALNRMATKQHKNIILNKRDTIILSSSVIPGNEISVRNLKDVLSRHDVEIIHYRVSDVHSSGHGNAEELAWINRKVGAKYFIPSYGFHSMLKTHADVAHNLAGVPYENIVIPDNGSLVEIQDKGEKITVLKEKAPSIVMTVDGFSVGNLQEVVIRDRQMLSQDGIFLIVVTINIKTGKLKKSPDIISRGFIYLRESQDLLKEARAKIKRIAEDSSKDRPIDFDKIKKKINTSMSRFLLQKTNKRPIVIAVVLGV